MRFASFRCKKSLGVMNWGGSKKEQLQLLMEAFKANQPNTPPTCKDSLECRQQELSVLLIWWVNVRERALLPFFSLFFFSSQGQFKAAFICWTVALIRLLIVVTDSWLSFAEGKLLTRIWNATVINDPAERATTPCKLELEEAPMPLLSGRPSGEMVKPEGRRGM